MEIVTLSEKHVAAVRLLMEEFYSSPAVSTAGSDDVFQRDIEACLKQTDFIKGYVFVVDETVVGYSMTVRSYSTEYARSCILIEDLYVVPEHRSHGFGKQFLEYLAERYPDWLLRLEVAPDNDRAIKMYERSGFTILPYLSMLRLP